MMEAGEYGVTIASDSRQCGTKESFGNASGHSMRADEDGVGVTLGGIALDIHCSLSAYCDP